VLRVRLRLVAALTLLFLVGPAGVLAATIKGTSHADRLVGTQKADTIDGGMGNDTILGSGGNDLLIGGPGRDAIFGGAGNDSIAANGDGARDTVSCGPGNDIVNADTGDAVASDCEVTSRQISTDTLAGGGGQHATEVEPDSFAFGQTVVAVFQVGRVETGGATAIGVATSMDGGHHWRSGLLPGLTSLSPQPGTDPLASDPTVGFDAAHGVWLATSLGIAADSFQILVSRSPDGVAWSLPVTVRQAASRTLDKEWVACDNWPSSPNRGHCYLSYLDVSSGIIVTQTSTDGGLAWSVPAATSIQPPRGVEANGAQPLPRPDGSLVVVYEVSGEQGPSLSDEVLAAQSADGGTSFEPSVQVSSLSWFSTAGVRAPPLPSADVASDGRLFVAWEDCRLDPSCSRDRILLSTSIDGQTWTAPSPVGPPTAAADQIVPGLAVDPATAGPAQQVAVAYYSLPDACADRPDCPGVDVWLTTSADAGASWARPQRLDARPMRLDWLPLAEGRFLGDYISTSYVGGRALPVYALAVAPFGAKLRQAIMALQTG
jgi:RTX calcium-binding nonapeptide repeat (4 copies)